MSSPFSGIWCRRWGSLVACLICTGFWDQESASAQITFAPAAKYQILWDLGSPCSVAADFNGDTRPDIAVCGLQGVAIFRNKGDGTFLTSDLFYGSRPIGIAAVDLNSDGRPDLVTASGNTVQVYLNQGGGSFLPPISYAGYPGYGGVRSVRSGDFDGDGKRDVAMSGDEGTLIFFNQGDGTLKAGSLFFKSAVLTPYGGYQWLSATGDVNSDGIDDLVVDTFDGGFQVFFGNRSRVIGAPDVYSFDISYATYYLADVNSDGKLDIVASEQYAAFLIMLNDGGGHFSPATHYDPNNFGYGLPLVIGGFSNDGLVEIIAGDLLFQGDGKGHFGTPVASGNVNSLYLDFASTPNLVADYDGNGLLDVSSFDGSTLSVYMNTTVPIVSKLNVVGIFPNHGGNAGSASGIQIVGNGFPADVKVTLAGPGGLISPTTTIVSAAGNLITVSFDLSGVAPGSYTLILKNSTGVVLLHKDTAYTVEQGGAADVWVDLVGRTAIRAGRAQVYYFEIGNRGNVDGGAGSIANLAFPNYISFQPTSEHPPNVVNRYSQATIASYTVPSIPPGGTVAIALTLQAPDAPEFAHRKFSVGTSLARIGSVAKTGGAVLIG